MGRYPRQKKKWQDHYSRKAKNSGFPARSVYKLEEIQQKFRLIKKGDTILDLGCYPGSWLLYSAKITGPGGQVIGIDKKPVSISLQDNIMVHCKDIFLLEDAFFKSQENKIHIVLSDMAPETSGNKLSDAARSFHLCQGALEIAQKVLHKGGAFVCKIFQGEDFKIFSDDVKNSFNRCKIFKPKSCRKVSKEIYIIGLGKR